MAKTSLEKSHSKSSNAKLTGICLLASLGVSAFWAGLGLIMASSPMNIVGYITLACGALVSVFSLFLISKFTR